ncbi:MAG: ATP-binding protein [Acetobacteraceae bacterium]|nr:ATP-binding protein [Acetobacteraceae bacterium]
MFVTAETVSSVLRSWIAIEVLTPQLTKDGGWNNLAADRGGRQRNRKSDAEDGPALWQPPGDDDPPPWRIPPDAPPAQPDPISNGLQSSKKERPWYSIILGALPAKDAFVRLDAAFQDQYDEDQIDRKQTGHIIAASVVLDEWGIMVPDSLAIASFAWGLGHMLAGGSPDGLSGWVERERDIKARFSDLLTPTGPGGHHRSLTWRDLRGASFELAAELGIPGEVWVQTPCAVELIRDNSPNADILSSFFLPDLSRILQAVDTLPAAASSYLGLNPPADTWDALSDRHRLSELLVPALFPVVRWPGPGLHPLTLLQQAAVNAIVRDLKHQGLAAVNGPPGTGKTTMLRDLVAHILVVRAEKLVAIETPSDGLGDIDLMDFAIVVASSNNTAVENVTLELPVRKKALDTSIWRDGGLEYFGHTATALLDLPADASEDERSWGLIAARLGRSENRRKFFGSAWWDHDWGLNDWLNQVGWPNAPQHRDSLPGKLIELDPPPRWPEAMRHWRLVRADFQRALNHCRRLRSELEEFAHVGDRLRRVEVRLPSARRKRECARLDYESACKAVVDSREQDAFLSAQEATETTKLAAITAIRPSMIARIFRTRAWRSHETSVRQQIFRLQQIQEKLLVAKEDLAAIVGDQDRRASALCEADNEVRALEAEAADLSRKLENAHAYLGASVPEPGFWAQPDEIFHQTSPWNEGQFRAARDELFAAAVRVHRAFIVAGVRALKPSLNTIAKAALGGPDAPKPSAHDWGVFFVLVPVVSTTFASIGRMFQTMAASEIGWLLIDEAGQAPPQQAAGAVWRARRAVVIGDPLQIEPIASTPKQTTRLICQSNSIDPAYWTAPTISAQILADRASRIRGQFPIRNSSSGEEVRITGMPLLVHRRCEQPMFDLANRIAYAGRMIFATSTGKSGIRDLLGETAWIDVDAPSTDKWVADEGSLIAQAIAELSMRLRTPPDLYVISPFRMPAFRLRRLLLDTPGILEGCPDKKRKEWVESRVGTVHTCQGKEAESVILMLGAGRGARSGSRDWAGGTPNLLNVAATRAKRSFYIVGNRNEWYAAGVFSEAAHMFNVRKPEEWLVSTSVEAQ